MELILHQKPAMADTHGVHSPQPRAWKAELHDLTTEPGLFHRGPAAAKNAAGAAPKGYRG